MKQQRRYDIDWIRVIAIALLMVYHVAIAFQPWGLMVGFMTNDKPWESLWLPMTMLNVWRIPILFFVAGMGVCFSFQNRNWKQLLIERSLRIGVPFVFGILCITPIYLFILQKHYDWKIEYIAQPSHLWFLGNILLYVFLSILPIVYLRSKPNGRFSTVIPKIFGNPMVFLFIIGCFVLETVLINPPIYEMYASTLHGFFLGWLAFIFGFLFAFSGDLFWNNLVNYRWVFLASSVILFAIRIGNYASFPNHINLPIETCLWVFTIFAFAKVYLNRPHKSLKYFSQAAYPIYIVHMIYLGLSSHFILPMDLNVKVKFIAILSATIGASLISYELINRIKYLKLLFGIKSS